MTLPGFVLGFLVSSLVGSLFHLWRGGPIGKLFLYLVLSWFGFWVGHWIASRLNLNIMQVGPLNLGLGIAGSILFLAAGYWLSLARQPEEQE